jgi:4-amino-4-deoxy-L-arabinose transferase-like glycosyltransferase
MNDTISTESTVNPGRLAVFGQKLVGSISKHENLYLWLATAIFTLSNIYHACTVPLWFDEFFTLFLSRLSSFQDMLKAMPADGQPPLQYPLTHLSMAWLGQTEFAVRLPELVAYLAVGLLVYRIVRLHGTAVQALFAESMVMGAYISFQAYTARPYGMLLAFTAMTFACWQTAAIRQTQRLLPLCGVALGIAGAILSHHYGLIYVGLFVCFGETVRLMQRRKFDGPMLAAIFIGGLALGVTLPLAHKSHLLLGEAVLHSTNYFFRPKLGDLRIYLQMAPWSLLILVLVFGLLPWHKRSARQPILGLPQVPLHAWAAVITLSLLLPIMLLTSAFATGVFASRYAIGASLGLALLAAWGLPRLGKLRTCWPYVLSGSTLCFLLLVATHLALAQLREPIGKARPAEQAVSKLLFDVPKGLPIVVANGLDYAPQWWYSPAEVRGRLIYLSDLPYAVKQPEFLPDLSLAIDRSYAPLPIADYHSFIASNSQFLLLCTGHPRFNWISPRLSGEGWHLDVIAKSGQDVLYKVHRE